MFSITLFVLTILFLIGTFFLKATSTALKRFHTPDFKRQLEALGNTFFYRKFHLFFFPQHEFEGLFFSTIFAQSITRFFSNVAFLLFLLLAFKLFPFGSMNATPDGWTWLGFFLSILSFMVISFIFEDCLPRMLGAQYPALILRLCTPIASLFLICLFPLTFLFLKIAKVISRNFYFDLSTEPLVKAQQDILEVLQKADFTTTLDAHDKKLIESVVKFKERIAREVMVPRVDVFSLSADISIKEAAQLLEKEGYSRTPVYQNTVDNIIGVLMYKDVLSKYLEYEQNGNDPKILEAPIETIIKNVLHTPETKTISSLLQEFRKKQVHLAIVVDEYGGTEGIVTIEDILEQIVGEIADEYDEEEKLYYLQSDGTWIVDARMNIMDVEDILGIHIPQEGEYDTVGGYIFHTAGTIPARGFVIHQDEFDMEILQSNDRCVEKVRIEPVKKS